MSYRSIKRALGETNIERKCRVLFGVCLGILVCGAFLCVDRMTVRLVRNTSDQLGRDFAKVSLFKLHWKSWVGKDPLEAVFVEKISNDLLAQDYTFSILSLGEDEVPWKNTQIREQPTEKEVELLEPLREEWLDSLDKIRAAAAEAASSGPALTDEKLPFKVDVRIDRVSAFTPSDDGRYSYYEPVYWTVSCVECHSPFFGTFSAADGVTNFGRASQPFRVLKVSLPSDANVIAETRAVLIAAAILMIFLAMVALYLIVRYVIVKPLKHLRDVSEEVGRGSIDLRADIHTNDEFEDLGDAFNRMLQHLDEAQGKLRNVNTDLDTKVDELAQLNMRLYEMNRLKSDFLANMSHELRTPLNSIIGFSEVLQGIDSLSDKQKRYANNIQKSGRVLLDMINDILDLAKLEAGKMELRPSEFQIDAVVNAQCDMVRPLSEEKNIDLEVRAADHQEMVYQDQGKIQQILTNLLSNAIKFTPEGGRIMVTVECEGHNQLALSVADTGVGIPDEDREIIFEKFRQSEAVMENDGLTREYAGTGLGLSIVKELCKLLGGEITFESELAKGSKFRVVIPWALSHNTPLGAELSRKLETLADTARSDFPASQPVESSVTPTESETVN